MRKITWRMVLAGLAAGTVTGVFGGGGGAGVTISPIAFIAVNGDNIKMLPVYNELTTLEKAVSMAPEIIDKAKDFFAKDNSTIIE